MGSMNCIMEIYYKLYDHHESTDFCKCCRGRLVLLSTLRTHQKKGNEKGNILFWAGMRWTFEVSPFGSESS